MVLLLQVRQYAAELVCVLSHLHGNGVIYVDLKPENVLLQDCGHIMLCDMDLAHTMSEVEMLRQMDIGESSVLLHTVPPAASMVCCAVRPSHTKQAAICMCLMHADKVPNGAKFLAILYHVSFDAC